LPPYGDLYMQVSYDTIIGYQAESFCGRNVANQIISEAQP